VYGWDKFVLLKHLIDQGVKKTAIARQLGVSRRLVYHWIETGQMERDLSDPIEARSRLARPTKLDRFRGIISKRLETYPELSAVRLYEECRAAGYSGGYTTLREYVRSVRPRPEPEPVVRFETPAGHQAQADFARFAFPWGIRYALLVVLGYSRLMWLGFYPRQTMQVLMSGLESAFRYFGGVPREILFDQLKAVIISDDRQNEGGKLLENSEFLRFSNHWDYRIRACRPYRAQTKGKVERPIYYVRDNFVYGREFLGDADLGDQAVRWTDLTANVRVHGTTKETPRERFERDERRTLKPLAVRPYQPLVLPSEKSTTSALDSDHLRRVAVDVERRDLGTYHDFAETGTESDAPVEALTP
jgi:transposase